MVLFRGSGPSGELSWWGIVLGIVVLVCNGWALFLSGGELSSWGVVLEPWYSHLYAALMKYINVRLPGHFLKTKIKRSEICETYLFICSRQGLEVIDELDDGCLLSLQEEADAHHGEELVHYLLVPVKRHKCLGHSYRQHIYSKKSAFGCLLIFPTEVNIRSLQKKGTSCEI